MMDGVRLTLLLGKTLPVPAPPSIVEALQSAEVTHTDDDRSGFTITFQVGRGSTAGASGSPLLRHPLLQPPSRLRLVVTLQGRPRVLIDGAITRHSLSQATQAGASTLTVTGEDLGILMDRDERQQTHTGMDALMAVYQVLKPYLKEGVRPEVFPPKGLPAPSPNDTIAQHETDYGFLRELAQRYGYVFYVAADPKGAGSIAYWGPLLRAGLPQRALSVNLGPATNVESLNFDYDSLAPEQVTGFMVDPATGQRIRVVGLVDDQVPLSRDAAATAAGTNVRESRLRATGHSMAEAMARARGRTQASTDALSAQGEIDVTTYGDLLDVRSLVGVRGAGEGHDGLYLVKRVMHRLQQGQYRMSFTLRREGKGSTVPGVRP